MVSIRKLYYLYIILSNSQQMTECGLGHTVTHFDIDISDVKFYISYNYVYSYHASFFL